MECLVKMTKDEVLGYLRVGRSRSVIVDQALCEHYPGWVRTMTIYPENTLVIEFDPYDEEDSGSPCYEGEYLSLDELIASLERYFDLDIAEWKNYMSTVKYPPKPDGLEKIWEEVDGLELLKHDMRNNLVELPQGANFTVCGLQSIESK